MAKSITITIPSAQYEDEDDCLAACAADIQARLGLAGWDLAPRWEDAQRETILLSVPDHAVCVIEHMPEYLRASHEAARNRGVYPHNGAERYTMPASLARDYVDDDWCALVDDADPANYEFREELV